MYPIQRMLSGFLNVSMSTAMMVEPERKSCATSKSCSLFIILHLNSGVLIQLWGFVSLETKRSNMNLPCGTVTVCSSGSRTTYSIPLRVKYEPAKLSILGLSRPETFSRSTGDVVSTRVISRSLQYDSISYSVEIGVVRT